MWTEQGEVERSINESGLRSKLTALPQADARSIFEQVETRFTDRKRPRWIWEHFREPYTSRRFEDDQAFRRLPLVVPSDSEDLLFFPGSDQAVVCAYRGTIGDIVTVLGDCPSFEYCIVPQGIAWLLCENHHGYLMAIGEPVESRLRDIEADQGSGGALE